MLDTHARRYVQPAFDAGAALAERVGITPIQLTLAAFAVGLAGGIFVALGNGPAAIALLWLSGYLDAVDGTLARRTGRPSAWGTVLDITFDRIVEFVVLAGLALRFPDSRMAIIVLLGAIIFSNVVFLVVGALSEKRGEKAFYYQAGLLERTEGFILLSLMIALTSFLLPLIYVFIVLEIFTGLQRLREAYIVLGNR